MRGRRTAPLRRRPARCGAYVIAADASLASGRDSGARDRFALTEEALVLLTRPEHFDAVVDRSIELLGAAPEGRLSAAWQMVDDALWTLSTTRHEWIGADPATVAAAGWVLVDRMGRLLIASALVAEAAKGGPAAETELLVNAARRYAWNHLRGPAPEAATATHVQRSADLVRAVKPGGPGSSTVNRASGRWDLSCSPQFRGPHTRHRRRHRLAGHGDVLRLLRPVLRRCRRHPRDPGRLGDHHGGSTGPAAPVPLGRLADRVGTGRFYVALLLLRGLGYSCFAFVSDFKSFLRAHRVAHRCRPVELTHPAGRRDGGDRRPGPDPDDGLHPGRPQRGSDRVASSWRAPFSPRLSLFVFTAVFVGNGLSFVVVACHGAATCCRRRARSSSTTTPRFRATATAGSDRRSATGGSWSSPSAMVSCRSTTRC